MAPSHTHPPALTSHPPPPTPPPPRYHPLPPVNLRPSCVCPQPATCPPSPSYPPPHPSPPPTGPAAQQYYSALDQARLAFRAYLQEQLAQELDAVCDDLAASEASLLDKSIRQSCKAAWKSSKLLSEQAKQAYLDRFPGGWRRWCCGATAGGAGGAVVPLLGAYDVAGYLLHACAVVRAVARLCCGHAVAVLTVLSDCFAVGGPGPRHAAGWRTALWLACGLFTRAQQLGQPSRPWPCGAALTCCLPACWQTPLGWLLASAVQPGVWQVVAREVGRQLQCGDSCTAGQMVACCQCQQPLCACCRSAWHCSEPCCAGVLRTALPAAVGDIAWLQH
jgi:hypothetical protein